MIHSLKHISDSVSFVTQHSIKDTVYVININSESVFLNMLPIIIAAIALIFTAYSIFISRRALVANIQHQKLSIQPLLTTFEDFTFRDPDGVGIKLISCGLGPAIIESFQLFWNGNRIDESSINSIYDSIHMHNIELGNFLKSGIIEKDTVKWILRIPSSELPKNRNNIIRAKEILEIIKKNLSYTIVFTSIYREQNLEYTLKYPFSST